MESEWHLTQGLVLTLILNTSTDPISVGPQQPARRRRRHDQRQQSPSQLRRRRWGTISRSQCSRKLRIDTRSRLALARRYPRGFAFRLAVPTARLPISDCESNASVAADVGQLIH